MRKHIMPALGFESKRTPAALIGVCALSRSGNVPGHNRGSDVSETPSICPAMDAHRNGLRYRLSASPISLSSCAERIESRRDLIHIRKLLSLKTGADRRGHHLPVYFVGWGSGQNVLQSYLDIPAVALFGLTPLGARIVPLIIGILAYRRPIAFLLRADERPLCSAPRRQQQIGSFVIGLCESRISSEEAAIAGN
jgi:hypothetical protein